jgi:hypothetical protein
VRAHGHWVGDTEQDGEEGKSGCSRGSLAEEEEEGSSGLLDPPLIDATQPTSEFNERHWWESGEGSPDLRIIHLNHSMCAFAGLKDIGWVPTG